MYPNFEYDKKLVTCHPSPRQLKWAQMEFYAFIHFTMSTFTGNEWGNGKESLDLFNPSELDVNQWVSSIKSAGMTGIILTAKHIDGFCLWPTAYTEHNIKNSPYRDGKGDLVRELSDACAQAGLKFGFYTAPWDQNCPVYGQGAAYDDFFCNQLTELCTNYGPIFEVWFDGACGEGPNGKKQVYDWERYYDVVRRLQPDANIAICGPDIRWCGNEAGHTRESEWSVLPTGFFTPEEVAALSQTTDDTSFREKTFNDETRDLGSREFLQGAKGYRWSPSETDTSIRPGWFYHDYEDDKVRSAETLMDIWYRTVGGNSSLLLNIPPDRRGLFHETDVKNLKELGDILRKTFARNLAETAVFTADKDDGYHLPEALRTDSYDAYYKSFDGENSVTVTVKLEKPENVTHVVLKEHIPMSQRVEKHIVEAKNESGEFIEVGRGTIIGYKKVHRFNPVLTDEIRIRITDSRVCPILSFVGIY